MTRPLACLAALLILAAPAAAQVPPDRALATMKPAAGFQVELFAHEPMLINPTAIDVDHKGRVWVAEAVNYRRVNFNRPLLRDAGDRIVVLTDTNGDGKADESTVFYQGKEIVAPLGVCVAPIPASGPASGDRKVAGGAPAGFRVYVAQSPDILVFEDADGDLKADGPPKKLLTGFQGFDHDHGVHGLSIGPDGKLYFTVGDAGVKGLQAADGKGPKWTSNSTGCRAGTVWRCDLDGKNLELIAHNFRNNYECCVDSFGEIWLSDNDDDGNQQTRICFVMPGGNYGYHPRGKGESHWHEEQPGVVHKTLRTGFGSPTGITFYEGSLLPEKYRGHLLHCDAGPREVRAFLRKPKGAGYELDKEVLLTSADPWFRPSAVRVAPDGSVFVADWYDPGVGGHGMGDWTRGRIYRLTPTGHKGYTVPPVKLDTPDGFLDALKSPCSAERHMAYTKMRTSVVRAATAMKSSIEGKGKIELNPKLQQELQPELDVIAKHWDHLPPFVRARLMWTTSVSNKNDWNFTPVFNAMAYNSVFADEKQGNGPLPPTLLRIDRDLGDNNIFYLARSMLFPLETLPRTNLPKDSAEALAYDPGRFVLAFGGTPATRRELLLTMCSLEAKFIKPVFYDLAKRYDGKDIFYRAALNIACGTDPARRDAILADFDKHFPEWNDTVADLVWELRPKSVLPRLEKLLGDAKLTGPQKARVLDILAACDDPSAGKTVLAVLKSDAAAEVKARALDQLRLFLPTKWKGLQDGPELAAALDALLADPKAQATGLQLVAAAGAVNQVEAVAKLAADATASLDTRKEAVRTLGKLPDEKAVAALVAVGRPENPLSIPCVQALGGLIPGGAKTPAYARKALDALTRGVFAADRGSPELKSACLAALAGSRAGTVWLLDAHAKKELPTELLAETGRLLRNSAYPDLRNKALLAFPPAGKLNLKALPPLAELAKRTGSAERGRQVWTASLTGAAQCAKCHTVRGVGGNVGPDLSMVGKKGSRENLFESIVLPSKAIADQYVQRSVTTAAGVTVSGLLVGDTAAGVTLRDANGKDTVIPKADVESARPLALSLMPEDIAAALTEDELIDLVAYLQTLQTAAFTPESFRVAGPFPAASMAAALKADAGPEKGPVLLDARYPASGGREAPGVTWRTLRADAKGYFDLAALHGKAGVNSASYLYTEVESPADQDAEVLLGTDDGAKLWVNGKAVFTHARTEAAAPARDTVPVKLTKGRNALLLKVANGNNPHGVYFTLLSKDEVKAVAAK